MPHYDLVSLTELAACVFEIFFMFLNQFNVLISEMNFFLAIFVICCHAISCLIRAGCIFLFLYFKNIFDFFLFLNCFK